MVSQYSSLLAPIAVDCVLKVADRDRPDFVDLRDIKIVKKLGGTVDDTSVVDGLVFDHKAQKAAGGPTRVEGAKIALVQFCVSPPKTDLEQNVVVSDYAAMDRVLKEERNYILQLVKKIKAAGVNVLLIQKSILRDATTDLSLHYLAKAKIMVVRDVERDEIEFISKTLNLLPVAHVDNLRPEKLGDADLVEEVACGNGRVVQITGIKNKGPTATVLLRGSNQLVLDEADRSLHDALCVVRCLVQNRFLLAGGGAPEMEISRQLQEAGKAIGAPALRPNATTHRPQPGEPLAFVSPRLTPATPPSRARRRDGRVCVPGLRRGGGGCAVHPRRERRAEPDPDRDRAAQPPRPGARGDARAWGAVRSAEGGGGDVKKIFDDSSDRPEWGLKSQTQWILLSHNRNGEGGLWASETSGALERSGPEARLPTRPGLGSHRGTGTTGSTSARGPSRTWRRRTSSSRSSSAQAPSASRRSASG